MDIPDAAVDALRAAGVTELVLRVQLDDLPAPERWLTVSEAALLHVEDRRPPRDAADRRRLVKASRAAISWACGRGLIVHVGTYSKRRVCPTSLAAWRLAWRQRAENRG